MVPDEKDFLLILFKIHAYEIRRQWYLFHTPLPADGQGLYVSQCSISFMLLEIATYRLRYSGIRVNLAQIVVTPNVNRNLPVHVHSGGRYPFPTFAQPHIFYSCGSYRAGGAPTDDDHLIL